MAKLGGCNADMVKGSVGSNSTRINPTSFARNNMSKGGVNGHMGGTDEHGKKPAVKSGGAAQGKNHHMPKGY